jgi:excisionase family DNA binding protein
MNSVEHLPEIMTPEQAADYLQVNRETIYRYIRDGRLFASKLGRVYRIPRRSVELLLWSSRTRADIPLRDYSPEDIEQFLGDDQLDDRALSVAQRFNAAPEKPAHHP